MLFGTRVGGHRIDILCVFLENDHSERKSKREISPKLAPKLTPKQYPSSPQTTHEQPPHSGRRRARGRDVWGLFVRSLVRSFVRSFGPCASPCSPCGAFGGVGWGPTFSSYSRERELIGVIGAKNTPRIEKPSPRHPFPRARPGATEMPG